MWRWLIGFAIILKVLYTLGLAVWSPAAPHAALPSRSTVVCDSSTGPVACFEVEAPAVPSTQAASG